MTIEDRLLLQDFTVSPISPAVQGAPFDKPASGITLHYSADPSLARTVHALAERKLGYHLIIDRDGSLHQLASLGVRVAHAGKADWRGQSPNQRHIAICLVGWGWLTNPAPGRYVSWSGEMLPVAEPVRMARGNVSGTVRAWHEASNQQMLKLMSLLRWFVAQGISAADICGHDECALPAGRKDDPGGMLPWRMEELRSLVAVTYGVKP